MELSKISLKGTKKKTHTPAAKTGPCRPPPDFGEFRLAQVCIPQVPHAAHEVFGVVRGAEFSEIWCNSATFHHLDITRVYGIHIYTLEIINRVIIGVEIRALFVLRGTFLDARATSRRTIPFSFLLPLPRLPTPTSPGKVSAPWPAVGLQQSA